MNCEARDITAETQRALQSASVVAAATLWELLDQDYYAVWSGVAEFVGVSLRRLDACDVCGSTHLWKEQRKEQRND